jgi:hypothetical protein
MMKVLMMLAALVSTPIVAGPINDGAYLGKGQWRDSTAESGEYVVSTRVKNGIFSSRYSFNGATENWEFTILPGQNSTFKVLVKGVEVGDGYCFQVQCHYQIYTGSLEETLTFEGDRLYKVGSKVLGGVRVFWQETLNKSTPQNTL